MLEPISGEDVPEVVVYLSKLCQEAGLAHAPLFLWNPLNQAIRALAFGRFRRYYVALSGGLITQFYTDQPAFRAIILHELSHLKNTDVNKTYFTVAIWWAFVLAALAPLFLYLLIWHPFPPLLTFSLLWRVLALAALVYLTRNAVLRAREFYADVRASTHDGVSEVLNHILTTHSSSFERSRIRKIWQALISVHPSLEERNRALYDTHILFRIGYWEAFGVGIAIGIALPNVQTLLGWLFLFQTGDFHVIVKPDLLGTVLIFTPLIVGTVGLNIWRAAFAAFTQGRALQGAGRAGLCLGSGIILGVFLSLSNFFEGSSFALIMDELLYNLLWAILLVVGLYCFFKWIAIGASAWLGIVTTPRSLRWIYTIGLATAGVILLTWSSQFFQLNTTSSFLLPYSISLTETIEAQQFSELLLQPLMLLSVIILWAFPLANWFWRNQVRVSTEASWAFIDISPQQISPPRQLQLRPGLALIVGSLGGLTFSIILLIIHIVLHLTPLSEVINNSNTLLDMFYKGQVILAILLQAVIAGMVTALVGRLGSFHGIFAAFVSGCIMTVGLFALDILYGAIIDPAFVWQTFCYIVSGGALLALPVTIGISQLVEWIDRPKHK